MIPIGKERCLDSCMMNGGAAGLCCRWEDDDAHHDRAATKQTYNGCGGRLKTTNSNGAASAATAHVLIFPFPAQGHINSMLRLAELLCLSGIKHITFVNSQRNHRLLVANNRHMSRPHPGIRFRVISDGLPDENDGGEPLPANRVWELHRSLASVFPQQLLEVVTDRNSGCACDEHGDQSGEGGRELLPPMTCAIVDGIMSFATEACLEVGIPVVAFRTVSACSFWVYNSVPNLIKAGELPFPADSDGCDLDEPIRSIPGMEPGLLRRRDLPKVTRVKYIKEDQALPILHEETRRSLRATALLLNSFEALESPVLSLIRPQVPHCFAVGPSHALLLQNNSLQPISEVASQQSPPTSDQERGAVGDKGTSGIRMNLWEEDPSCISWLDQQPPKSVVYVSFGSFTVMTKDQVLEIWHGLVASAQRFMWVLRSDTLVEAAAGEFPVDSDKKTSTCIINDHVHGDRLRPGTVAIPCLEDDQNGQDQYLLVNWAPQEEVLNHPSVGGFFTHCGWNSTLESIVAGVPMLCWPFFADQHVNSRFVERVWKVGIDIKDICNRDKVTRAVRDLMQGPKAEELRDAATKLADAAKAAVARGGSSYSDFQKFVQWIKLGDFSS